MIKVSDYLVQLCADAGISDVFVVNGGGAMHLNDSFGHSPVMRCTYQHNEQACAMAAEAYARVQQRPAMALVTSGPGATNAMTGVLCAWMESIPMLVISGQVRFATTVRSSGLNLRSMGIQEFDITKAAAAMTKYAVMIERKEDVRYCAERALYEMTHGRKGPVWLDIPLDVQAAEIDPEAQNGFIPETGSTSDYPEELIEQIIGKLKNAERPVLFGGYGVRAAGGEKLFLELAELLGAPVLTGMSSVDLIPNDHPLYAGRTGMTGSRGGNLTMAGSDVFFSVGSRQSFLQTGFNYRDWAREAYTILNDLDPEELKKPNLHVSLPVAGDARTLMEQLIRRMREMGVTEEHPLTADPAWTVRSAERERRYPVVTASEKGPQPDGKGNLYAFYDMLSEFLPEGAQLLASCGTSRVTGTQAFRVKEGQRFYTNSATASMGYGLPAAVGLARALNRTDRTDGDSFQADAQSTGAQENACGGSQAVKEAGKIVNVVDGEGSCMMNLQELQTIATNRLPVRIFLICNGGYHSIRQTQQAYFGEPLVGIGEESGDLGFPDPAKLADTFGLSYGTCLCNETLAEDLAAAMELPLPALIRVEVSPLQKTEPKAASRKLEDGRMVSAPLEDMAPFLSREDLEAELEIPMTESEQLR
ncbi:MAG: thiamine pyrophosphate-binding protein [Eubacterium sp.]|nr:thiamine pyrophosphate-binding protein [Eubacterium sp.]